MRNLRTEIQINASPQKVWEILTDFESYPDWNPFVTNISGDLVGGHHLSVRLEMPGGKPMEIKPVVTRALINEGLSWKGSLWFPGLFDGEHKFTIREIHEDRVRFVQEENFSGLLTPFIFPKIQFGTREGFEKMNMALRDRAEAGSAEEVKE
jgi:hypothetical protein